MSNPNIKPSVQAVAVGMIAPVSIGDGATAVSGAVDMSLFINAQAVVLAGAMGVGTATVQWQQATDEAFSDAKAVGGRVAVSLSENLPVQLNLLDHELDSDGDFRFVRVLITVTGAAVLAGAVVLGHDAKDQPADAMTGAVID